MAEKERYIAIEDGEETPITNMYHLKRDLTFLFRTGNNDEEINDLTPLDWVIFPEFDEETFNMGELESREQLRDICSDAITGVLVGDDENAELTDEMLENYLFKFTVAWVNENGEPVSDETFGAEERDFIVNHFRNNPYAFLIALVCHKDGNDGERLYGIFVWLPGKLNRIESVLMPPDEQLDMEYMEEAETADNKDEGEETKEKHTSNPIPESDIPSDTDSDNEIKLKPKTKPEAPNITRTPPEIQASWAEKLKFKSESDDETADNKNKKDNGDAVKSAKKQHKGNNSKANSDNNKDVNKDVNKDINKDANKDINKNNDSNSDNDDDKDWGEFHRKPTRK